MISGTRPLASVYVDICASIPLLGSCPIAFSATARYTQLVTIQLANSPEILQPQTRATSQFTLNTGAPNLIVDLNFTLGTLYYPYSVSIPTAPVPGTYTYSISLSAILVNLIAGLGLPLESITDRIVSLDLPLGFNSTIQGDLVNNGFSPAQALLIWNQPTTLSYDRTLSGLADDSSMVLKNLAAVFSFQAQLVFKVPLLLISDTLASFKINLAKFGPSPTSIATDWYHVNIQSPYNQPAGSGWYISGSTATFTMPTTTYTGSGNTYDFAGWAGTGPGSYSGQQQSNTITVTGPVTESATWNAKPTGPFGAAALSSPIVLAILTAFILIVATSVIAITIATRRKHPP